MNKNLFSLVNLAASAGLTSILVLTACTENSPQPPKTNAAQTTPATEQVKDIKSTPTDTAKAPLKEVTIAFNPQFVMDPLRNLDADEVFMELTDELSPGVIKVNAPFLYVIMPMRLS